MTHTVVAGDDLWSISKARLGAGERWVEVFSLNRDTLQSPDHLEVGQVLKIPTAPVEVPPEVMASLAPTPAPAAPRARATAAARPSANQKGTQARSTTVRRVRAGGGLDAIRRCESGGNYAAVSSSGKYRGAYQFDQRTWESVGGSGDPAAASPAEQDARAQKLRSQRGSSPWPNCG